MSAKVESKSRDLKDVQKKLSGAADALQKIAKPVFEFLVVALPVVITYFGKARAAFEKLPQNTLNFVIGFIFCFFGGMYPVLFAAVQAAEHGGRQAVMEAVQDLAKEATIIIEESKKDDKVDADKDGKNDTSELSSKEYMMRKTNLVLTKMNPEKVDKAISRIYRVWLSVVAVLAVQFAQAISMALAISDFMKRPVDRFIAPTVKMATPDEYDKWVPIILGWICKAIGMSIAWLIQTVRAAFASALTGGLMMSKATYNLLLQHDITLGGMVTKNMNDSVVDEGLSYVFAAIGFYFQYKLGFQIPSLLKVVFFPFEIMEYYMRWSITK